MTCRPHSFISGSALLLSVRYWLAGHLSAFQKKHRDYNVIHPGPLAQPLVLLHARRHTTHMQKIFTLDVFDKSELFDYITD